MTVVKNGPPINKNPTKSRNTIGIKIIIKGETTSYNSAGIAFDNFNICSNTYNIIARSDENENMNELLIHCLKRALIKSQFRRFTFVTPSSTLSFTISTSSLVRQNHLNTYVSRRIAAFRNIFLDVSILGSSAIPPNLSPQSASHDVYSFV